MVEQEQTRLGVDSLAISRASVGVTSCIWAKAGAKPAIDAATKQAVAKLRLERFMIVSPGGTI
jgi:hypothetical protein